MTYTGLKDEEKGREQSLAGIHLSQCCGMRVLTVKSKWLCITREKCDVETGYFFLQLLQEPVFIRGGPFEPFW